MSSDSRLHDAIYKVYESHNDRPSISPSWLATETMHSIAFPRNLHELGYIGCHLQLRQIARSYCRKHFDPEETVENDLFPDTLQQRYPRLRQADSIPQEDGEREDVQEPEYILLDMLQETDAFYNVARLRKEGRAKLRHADALEAWAIRKFRHRTA